MNGNPVSTTGTNVTAVKKQSVLCVDDERLVLDGLRAALHHTPYRILTACSGEEALRMLDETGADVVLSDEQMPNMTGSQLLGIVRKRYPHTVRIVLTGRADLDAAIRAINEGGVHRFLTKPCNPAELALAIQQGLQMRDLARESSRLLARTCRQEALLRTLEEQHPGITAMCKDDDGTILLDDEEDVQGLLTRLERENRKR